jgi:hypothetical protein
MTEEQETASTDTVRVAINKVLNFMLLILKVTSNKDKK